MGERERGLFERKVQRSTKGQGSIQASPTLTSVPRDRASTGWVGELLLQRKR